MSILSCLILSASACVDPTPHAVPKAVGGVFLEGVSPTFGFFNVTNDNSVCYRIVDWRENVLVRGVWPTNRVLSIPEVPCGYYRVEIDEGVARGTTFAVVGDPARMAFPKDSFYGTDAAFSWCAYAFTCPWRKGDQAAVVADLMRLAGLKHIRERLSWEAVQSNACGPTVFGIYGKALDVLSERGFTVVDYYSVAPWRLRATPSSRHSISHNLGAIYDISRKAAKAFWPTVGIWEFWNEQEGAAPEPVWDYTAAMKAAALGYRAGAPDGMVLNGSLVSIDRVRYTDEIFRGGAWKYINAFNFHYYDAPAGCESSFQDVRAYLKRNSLEDAAIIVTECGSHLEGRTVIPSPPPWGKYKMHSRDQEMLMMEFYPKSQILMQMSGALRNYFFNFCAYNEGGAAFAKDWGVMRRDGTVKPIFSAIAAMTRTLETSRIVGELKAPADGVRAFLFERPDGLQTIAYFSTSHVDTLGKTETTYGTDRLIEFTLPASHGRRYELTDPVGGVKTVLANGKTISLTASRHTSYVSGFKGLSAIRPAAPRGKILNYRPNCDEDLSVVFRIDLNTNDFAVVAAKSMAEMRVDRGRVKVTAWNLDEKAKRGRINCTGAQVTGVPREVALPAFGTNSFEATVEPISGAPLETRLIVDGVFAGKRATALEMPLFFEKKFMGEAERVEMKGSRDVKLWAAYGNQCDFSCAWDEKEKAIRMDLTWNYQTENRWFFPRMSLGPHESLEDVKCIEFEVKSVQDKFENDYRSNCQYAQFDSSKKDGGGWVSYIPPQLDWEPRRISLGGVKQRGSTTKIGFGGMPQGFKVTYWIRNICAVRARRAGEKR